ncbi:hypothetical protein M514_23713 [Trichuris suis]|uniref:Uncharacterized protein n=1 Tax=Trichuris suis TaxID=68888 RepID=A0A085N3T6_9BILA|nr:hypothetical protein M514_23713 [Trichuris suis]
MNMPQRSRPEQQRLPVVMLSCSGLDEKVQSSFDQPFKDNSRTEGLPQILASLKFVIRDDVIRVPFDISPDGVC